MNYLTSLARGFGWGSEGEVARAPDEEDVQDIDMDVDTGVVGEKALWQGAVSLHLKAADGSYDLYQERVLLKVMEYEAREVAEGDPRPPKYGVEFVTPREGKVVVRSPVGDALEVGFHRATHAFMFDAQLQDSAVVSWAAQLLEPTIDPDTGDALSLDATMEQFVALYNKVNYLSYVGDVEDAESVPENPEECDVWSCGGLSEGGGDEEEGSPMDIELDLDEYEDTPGEASPAKDGAALSPPRVRIGAQTDVNVMMEDHAEAARLLVLKRRQVDGKHAAVLNVSHYEHGGFKPNEQHDLAELKWKGADIDAMELVTMHGRADKPLLLDPDAPTGGVYQTDLETGKVVENYLPVGDGDCEADIDHILATDPTGDQNLLTCLTGNSVFAMDLRLDPRKCGVHKQDSFTQNVNVDWGLQVKSAKQHFSCHATSKDGKLAVGNRKGDIRFYSGTPGMPKSRGKGQHPKTAKTLLKGAGHPVQFLDISEDSDWLIATFDKYLMLVKTTFEDDKGSQLCGFNKPMGKHKPQPIKLTLDFARMRALGADTTFRKAKFERHGDGRDSRIVAAIGNTMVSWNLDNIKKDARSGREHMATKVEDASLVDISASATSEGHTVKYMTEQDVIMATPHTTKRSVRKGGKYTATGLAFKR